MSKKHFRANITHGYLHKTPIWEVHHRGVNEMEVIVPKGGGGELTFRSLPRNDDLKSYRVAEFTDEEKRSYPGCTLVSLGAPVRFKADYKTGALATVECRWYGVIEELTTTSIKIKRYRSLRDAFEASCELSLDKVVA